MKNINNKNLNLFSKQLRKNMTEEERKLWYTFLNRQKFRFKRQKIIGKYIVDFYCSSAKLVIELDGSQHYTEEMQAADAERDKALSLLGIKVLRYTNLQINQNFENVCKDIWFYLNGEK